MHGPLRGYQWVLYTNGHFILMQLLKLLLDHDINNIDNQIDAYVYIYDNIHSDRFSLDF